MAAPKNKPERTEGWGHVTNARNACYFRNDRSLCGRWLALGGPEWEINQELGFSPTKGTCKGCWKKRAKEEGPTMAATSTRSDK